MVDAVGDGTVNGWRLCRSILWRAAKHSWLLAQRVRRVWSISLCKESDVVGGRDNDVWVGSVLPVNFYFSSRRASLYGAARIRGLCGGARIGEAIWTELSAIQAGGRSLGSKEP